MTELTLDTPVKRVRIVASGNPGDSHVFDADTGEEYAVTSADITITNEGVQCVLYIETKLVLPIRNIAEFDITTTTLEVAK